MLWQAEPSFSDAKNPWSGASTGSDACSVKKYFVAETNSFHVVAIASVGLVWSFFICHVGPVAICLVCFHIAADGERCHFPVVGPKFY
jgi:uncharacterized membrane protein